MFIITFCPSSKTFDSIILLKIVLKKAIPTAPAILRTRLSSAEETPTSFVGTEFVAADVIGAILRPIPKAKTIKGIIKSTAVVLTSKPENK